MRCFFRSPFFLFTVLFLLLFPCAVRGAEEPVSVLDAPPAVGELVQRSAGFSPDSTLREAAYARLEELVPRLRTPLLPYPDVPTDRRVRLLAVGDIMLGSDYPKPHLPPGDDPLVLLADALPYLRDGDLVFGNLEGGFLSGGLPSKGCRDASRCYVFRMPPRYSSALLEAGFNMLSLANNHVNDFGLPARTLTRRLLDSLGIAHAGQQASPVDSLILENGVRVGFCAFAPNSGCCQLNDAVGMRRIVSALAARFDIVIASCHMGAEGRQARRLTGGTEIYAGENRGNPQAIARLLIDAGADVVLGHGPHVVRALDLYKGRLIAYSLGNFCTYGGFNVSGINGYAPLLEANLDGEGRFLRGRVHSFSQHGRSGPRADGSRRVVAELRELMSLDAPSSGLVLDEDGTLRLKE